MLAEDLIIQGSYLTHAVINMDYLGYLCHYHFLCVYLFVYLIAAYVIIRSYIFYVITGYEV